MTEPTDNELQILAGRLGRVVPTLSDVATGVNKDGDEALAEFFEMCGTLLEGEGEEPQGELATSVVQGWNEKGGGFLCFDPDSEEWGDLPSGDAVAWTGGVLNDLVKTCTYVKQSGWKRTKAKAGVSLGTKINNKSDRDIVIIIAYQEIQVTRAAGAAVGFAIFGVQVSITYTTTTTTKTPPKTKAMIKAHTSEPFQTSGKYFLSIYSLDSPGKVVCHLENQQVNRGYDWDHEQVDLKKEVGFITNP